MLAELSLWALTVCIYSVHRSPPAELLAYGCLLTSTVKHSSLSQTGRLSSLFISIPLMPAPPGFTSCLSCGFPDRSSLVLCHLFLGLPLVPFWGPLSHLSPPCLLSLSVRLVRHNEEGWGVSSGPTAATLSLGQKHPMHQPWTKPDREAKEETSSFTIKETSLCDRGRPLQ